MGFDLNGMNPVTDKKQPMPQDFTNKIVDEDNYFTEMSKSEREKYFAAKWDWQDRNPGTYFRNNVWWWRPLWLYVENVCSRTITHVDWDRGNYNDGYEIDDGTADVMADMLEESIKNGFIDVWKKGYDKEQESEKWDYPFHKDNVQEFIKFCRESGGFQIC